MEVSLRVMSLEIRVYLRAVNQTGDLLFSHEGPLSLRGLRTSKKRNQIQGHSSKEHKNDLHLCHGMVTWTSSFTFP